MFRVEDLRFRGLGFRFRVYGGDKGSRILGFGIGGVFRLGL